MKKIVFPFFLFSLIFLTQNEISSNEQSTLISYTGGKNYTFIERTDLRRYDNGKYIGLVSRQVSSFIEESGHQNNYLLYDGNFYLDEGTKRANISIGPTLNEAIPSVFKITEDGNLEMIEDNGYPSFRSFPSYPKKEISIGERWQSKAIRCVDPLNKGIFTKIPFYVEYTYLRDEIYNGEDVFLLSAKWATRYGTKYYIDYNGDKDLIEAQGSHNATIYVSKNTGAAIVIRDSVNEVFTYTNGAKIQFKGTINLFTKYQPALDKEKLLPILQRVATKVESPIYIPSKESTYIANSESMNSSNYDESDFTNINTSYWVEQIHSQNDSTEGGTLSTENLPNNNSPVKENAYLTYETTKAGIKLTIPNLQFKPDSSELLPTENQRLKQIAEILSNTGTAVLLVEGHTASTGNEKGEMQLSKDRAIVIAQKLATLGIDSSRFIIRGHGSHKPIADNSTKEGMAKNRRVEITITE